MSKKVFNLISAVLGGCQTAAVGVVTYMEPASAPAIVASITAGITAVIAICGNFVKESNGNV